MRAGYKGGPFAERGRSRFSFEGKCPYREGACPNGEKVFCYLLSRKYVVVGRVQLADVRISIFRISKQTK